MAVRVFHPHGRPVSWVHMVVQSCPGQGVRVETYQGECMGGQNNQARKSNKMFCFSKFPEESTKFYLFKHIIIHFLTIDRPDSHK